MSKSEPLTESQRRWHYQFAHLAVRMPAFMQADQMISAFSDPQRAPGLIFYLMERVAASCGLTEDQTLDLAESIQCVPCRIDTREGCVIVMPPPQCPSECYFMAIVREDHGVGYYTLELSSFGNPPMLCGWSADGMHLNYGEGPTPDVDAFVAAIEALQSSTGREGAQSA